MSGYIAFVKKEFTENIKNYRFLILFAVFLVFGIMSAFLASGIRNSRYYWLSGILSYQEPVENIHIS